MAQLARNWAERGGPTGYIRKSRVWGHDPDNWKASTIRAFPILWFESPSIDKVANLANRYETTHPNGNIFFSKITEVLRVVHEIQTYSKPIIERCYRRFPALLRLENKNFL